MGDLDGHDVEPPPRSRRDVLKYAMLGAAALPAAGCVGGQASGAAAVSSNNRELKHMANTSKTELDLLFQPAHESARMIRDREITSVDLVSRYLDRIALVNPEINAVVKLADGALESAARADADLAAGNLRGPLHGIPMTIKDCFDTAGVVSTWGTKGRRQFIPGEDATVVARLKAAGAILVGKTNTPEFTLSFETHNDLFGFTHNPYRLSHSPGGSSGGAAALLAVGGIPFDIGTDYGGSVRVPSHCCGTVGIKPTSGGVPRTGLCLPPGMLGDDLSHIGPMARTVEDLKLLLPLIWGPDGRDSRIPPVPLLDVATVDLAELRCAVTYDNGIVEPDAETRGVVANAARLLAAAGVRLNDDRLPTASDAEAVQGALWFAGAHASVQQLLETAGTARKDWSIDWFRDIADDVPKRVTAEQVNEVLVSFESVRSRSLAFMDNYDLIVSPVNARPAQPHPKPGGAPFPGDYASYTSIHDVTGFPAGVVRGGMTSDGLPIGVQIIGKPWREDLVLAAMSHLESALGEFPRPPAFAG